MEDLKVLKEDNKNFRVKFFKTKGPKIYCKGNLTDLSVTCGDRDFDFTPYETGLLIRYKYKIKQRPINRYLFINNEGKLIWSDGDYLATRSGRDVNIHDYGHGDYYIVKTSFKLYDEGIISIKKDTVKKTKSYVFCNYDGEKEYSTSAEDLRNKIAKIIIKDEQLDF